MECTECVICFEPIQETNKCILPCGHTFHTTCSVKCMVRRDRCPLCRATVGCELKLHSKQLINPPIPIDQQMMEILKSLKGLVDTNKISDDRYHIVKNLVMNGKPLADN